MTFEPHGKYLIVADKAYRPMLLKAKNHYPSVDIKLMSKNDLLDCLSFSFTEDKDPLPYLLGKETYDYSQLKKILQILRVGDIGTDPMFRPIYEDLEKGGFLHFDPYGAIEVKGRRILLFEDDEDIELRKFLSRQKMAYQLIHFEDFGYRPRYDKENQPTILAFENRFQQYFHIFSDMRAKLLKDPTLQRKFLIQTHDDEDLFYVSYLKNLFDIPVRTNLRIPFSSDNLVHENLEAFHKNRNFEFVTEIPHLSPALQLKTIIDTYGLKKLKNFSFAYASLMEILSAQTMNVPYDDKGIRMTNQFVFDDDILYVTNFQHDDFYQEFDDSNVVSDKRLEELGVNPSYVKTQLDHRLKRNYVLYHDIALLSRVMLHLQDKIYDSQFLEEFGWKTAKADGGNLQGIFTTKARDLLVADCRDMAEGKPTEDYKDYTHKVTAFDAGKGKKHYSASDLKAYFQCPYYYYLEKVVHLSYGDKNQDKTAARIGKLVHKVFEDIYTRDYTDFDETYDNVFNSGIEEYREDKDKDGRTILVELTVEDKATIEFLRYWLKDIVRTERGILEKREDSEISHIIGEAAEKRVTFSLTDEDGHEYPFVGVIDKLIYTQGASTEKYVSLVDYKTGISGDFHLDEVFLGGSLQLPLYAMALRDDRNAELSEGYTFAGFNIQHIYLNSLPKDKAGMYTTQSLEKACLIGAGGGITLMAQDYVASLDASAISFKKDETYNPKAGRFLAMKNPFDDRADDPTFLVGKKKIPYELKTVYDDATKAALRIVKAIEKSQFEIAPTVRGSNGKPLCQFCAYKDICYHSKADFNDIEPAIRRRFGDDAQTEEDE